MINFNNNNKKCFIINNLIIKLMNSRNRNIFINKEIKNPYMKVEIAMTFL
jgi:hypothetical protein